MTSRIWQAGRFQLDLSTPKIMGIVNVTPDSFSDGGTYSAEVSGAIQHAERLLQQGADILDIGGESTRPHAAYVSPAEEWARVAPILQVLHTWQVPISLDTRHTVIMQRALEQGWVDIINDVQALEDEGAVNLLAQYPKVGVCLMHMQGLPQTMQDNPHYQDVVCEVSRYLKQRLAVCEQAGIARERMVLDVGFGFGKTLEHNVLLMQHLDDLLQECDAPLLVGVSRKRMIGDLTGETVPSERVHGSVAAALAAVARGAQIIRVHDDKATVDAVKVWQAVGGKVI